MRPALLRISIAFICLIYLSTQLSAQNCFNTGLNGTVINLPCNQNCVNVPVRIPHLKSTSDYTVNTIAYNPYPYVTSTAYEAPPSVYADDFYSPKITLPFAFCFYDSLFTKAVIGSNGIMTFDTANSDCSNAYTLSSGIPLSGGTICQQFGTYYPKAAIMGAYSDLDPRISGTPIPSPSDRKIQWEVLGTAPCRKFVLSYFHVGVFGTSCGVTTPNTFQIVIYESTGIIEVFFEQKACSSSTNNGRAILGIQNWNRDKALAAPGKNNTVWNETNTGYQFVPSGGASRFVSCVVQTLAGTFLGNGDTTTTVPGTLDVTFPTFCPAGAGGQYVIKTTFSACDNPTNQIISYDTITINKTVSLNATQATTQTSCGVSGTGTATITVPTGLGTAPYTFVLSPGGTTFTGNSPQQFISLAAGNYSVLVTDAGTGGCSSTVPFTITSTGALAVTYTVTNTSCVGAANGSIVVNPPNGTPPFTYSINGGLFVTNNTFSGLAPGTYFVSTHDNAGCQANLIPVTVSSGTSITMTTSTVPTTCPGAANGSITITGATGTAPYLYSINGGPYQSSPTFTGLVAGTYFISLVDASGCTVTFIPVTVDNGTGTVTGTAAPTSTSCAGVNDGKITVSPTSGTGPYQYSINNGTSWQSSNVFTGLAPGSYNILIREGGACISNPIPVTITAGNGLQAGITSSATSCTGANNGSITVTMTSGTPVFTFVLDGTITQTSATNTTTFINVSAGPHSVTVTAANGCVTTAPVTTTVTSGAGFTSTFAPAPTGCAGANNGAIAITSQAPGVAPYTVVLTPGSITQTSATSTVTFNNLAAGTYSAVIRDANGCQFTLNNMVVTAGAGLVATPTPTATTCAGVNNGSISVTMGSGAAPFIATMDGAITQTSATNIISFTAVSAGPHSITVTDANGCVTTAPVTTTVATGTGFTSTFTPTPTGCVGVNNGKLVLNPQNPGTAPFTAVLNPGAVTQTSPTSTITFNNLAAGTYSAVITDANGCQVTLNNMTVTAGAGLIATPTPTGTSCTGVNNGNISINMGSGAAPYTAIMDGTVTQTSATNIISFVNVSAGPHSITVTDANGCITSAPVTTTVATGAGFTVMFAPTPTGCAGASNGKLVLSPQSTATAPFTAVLNPGSITQTSATSTITFNNLVAGTYSAVVTDANGCQFTLNNMNVAAGNPLNATPTPLGTSCNGAANGSINVTPATNGTAPYLYSLNGGTTQVSPAFNGLAAGAYTINVTDAGGCSSGILNTTIIAGPSINVRPDKIDAACFNSLTGRITAVPSSNATAPVQYSLNNVTWQASPNFTGLAAGTYNVYILDAIGCTNSADTTIGQPMQLSATPSLQSVLCKSGNDGKIFINATGGTSPYLYSLDNITFQASGIFSVTAGSYTVYVKDANGCTINSPLTVNVTEPALLTATPATTNATCDGGNDGTINIIPAGGVSPYQYAVTGGTFQATGIFNVGPGTYAITVKDVNGCTYPMTGVVVGLTNNLTLTPATDPSPICEGNIVQLQTISNATQFSWTPVVKLSSTSIANPIANPTTPTLYVVTATLGRCSVNDSVLVDVMAAPIPDAGPPGDICYGKTYQLQGSGGVTYSWAPSTYLSSSSVYNPMVTPDKTTAYSLTVTDANGCTSVITDQVIVKVTPPIKVTTYPFDTVVYAGAGIPLLATSVGTDYTWTSTSGVAGLDNPNIPNPVATAPFIDGTVIIYKVTVTTSAGCQGDGFVKIQVYKGPDIYVVTAFTPNGDGRNDTFIPFPVGIKKLNYFKVFNRWGQMVYSTTTLNKGWDGNLGGIEQSGGVYVWMVEGVTMDNKVITKKGTVTLIR